MAAQPTELALPADLSAVVKQALAEDIGTGDLTASLVPEDAQVNGTIITREAATICGQAWVNEVFAQLDASIQLQWRINDGATVQANQVLCAFNGPARPILTGERTALNFLQTLSGTATLARRFSERIKGTKSTILDTRKTLPGLRTAQKYATVCGGCQNHRIGLFDAILIKENHILAAGSITSAVATAKQLHPEVDVEVEVESVDEAREALEAKADALLLDNFPLPQLRKVVSMNNDARRFNRHTARLEASGGINLTNVRAVADTGVDFISVGGLTKDVTALDLSMRFD